MRTIGEQCPKCLPGKLRVTNTVVNLKEQTRTQYLCCDVCKHRPEDNKRVVPLQFAPERK